MEKYKCTSTLELKQEQAIASMELGDSQFDLLTEVLKMEVKLFKKRVNEEYEELANGMRIDSDELLKNINQLN